MNERFFTCLIVLPSLFAISCHSFTQHTNTVNNLNTLPNTILNKDTAIFASGCFWCTEAIFQRLKGVEAVQSGYIGGVVNNPSYKEVCSGRTGHAEACRLIYNPDSISYLQLLQVFFATHDPTELNRQGNDVGTKYRSAIFYFNEAQKQYAIQVVKELTEHKIYDNPIVTEISPATTFYPAEEYHNNYFKLNGDQTYCRFVIHPKLQKFEKIFKDLIRADSH